jgi:hypothetical protein
MAGNTTPAGNGSQTQSADLDQRDQRGPEDQEGLPDSTAQLSEPSPSAKCPTSGRMPLFGR